MYFRTLLGGAFDTTVKDPDLKIYTSATLYE